MVSFLEAPFKLLQNFVSWVGEIWQLLLESFKHLRRRRWLFALTLDQIATNGINSLPIVLLTVSAAGAVLALYTAHELASRGGERFVGWLVAYTVFREVAPVATGLVIAARVGSAYAAEIGTMKVTEQIDALRVMGVSPVAFLVPAEATCLRGNHSNPLPFGRCRWSSRWLSCRCQRWCEGEHLPVVHPTLHGFRRFVLGHGQNDSFRDVGRSCQLPSRAES